MTFLCLLLCKLLFAQFDPFIPDRDTILTRADQMPYFIGCEAFDHLPIAKRECSNQELVRFISRYLVYPEKAKYDGTEGTVFVSFIIDETGMVSEPVVLMDIGGGCGQAALDVIKEMPRWEPALHQGHVAKVKMNLPIQFFLRAEGRDEAEPYILSWGTLTGKQVTKDQLLNNLSSKIYVRGPEGSSRFVDQVEFVFQKDGRFTSAFSRGDISPELEKVVQRVKKDGTFSIRASVQDNGQFVTISRTFSVTK